jgi:hypothetical protein
MAIFTCEIQLRPGEKLSLPASLVDSIGSGRWLVTFERVSDASGCRRHDASLNGYAAEDDGLYDDICES